MVMSLTWACVKEGEWLCHWHGHVSRRENGRVIRMGMDQGGRTVVSLVWACVEEGEWSCDEKDIRVCRQSSADRWEGKKDMEVVGGGETNESCLKRGKGVLPIKVDCWP